MATLNVPVPDAVVSRIQAAFGQARKLGRPATLPEVIEEVRQYLKAMVIDQETTKTIPPDTGI